MAVVFDPLRVGRSLRAIRIRLGLRQADVAARARVSRSFVSYLELGKARSADLALVERVCAALGADLDVRVRWKGEGLDRLLDEAHASVVDRLVGLLDVRRWQSSLEVTFNHFGDRGSIDVFAWHPDARELLIVEVKSVVADAQGTLAPLDRKVRVAAMLARDRDLEPRSISRLLVMDDTTTNRRRVGRFETLFAAALPDRGWDVRRWLARPSGRLAGLLFLPDSAPAGTRRSIAGRTRVNRPRNARKLAG